MFRQKRNVSCLFVAVVQNAVRSSELRKEGKYAIVKDKEYFVLTTNVDHQFYKAGFELERMSSKGICFGSIIQKDG